MCPTPDAAVTGIPDAVDVPDLPTQSVGAGPRRPNLLVHHVRFEHLGHRVGGQHTLGASGEEGRPTTEVGDGRPQLTSRRHCPGVVLGLTKHEVGHWVHRPALSSTAAGAQRRSRHAERHEQVVAHHLEPRSMLHDLEEVTERGIPDIRVVEAPPGPEALPDARGDEFVPGATGGAFPPRSRCLGLQPGGVGQQLLDGHRPEGRPRNVLLEPVGEVESPGIPQAQDRHGDKGFRDRTHPELRVIIGRRGAHAASSAGPDQRSVTHDAGDQSRHAPLDLGGRHEVVEAEDGSVRKAHAPTLCRGHVSRRRRR